MTKNLNKVQGDKIPVLGMKQRNGTLRLVKFNKTNKENIKPILDSHISSKAMIYTDESPVYNYLTNRLFVNHKAKQYVIDNITTNGIEGAFSHFKRSITGIYHWCSKNHIQKYADTFCFRWNTKELELFDRINLFFDKTPNKKLEYKDLIK